MTSSTRRAQTLHDISTFLPSDGPDLRVVQDYDLSFPTSGIHVQGHLQRFGPLYRPLTQADAAVGQKCRTFCAGKSSNTDLLHKLLPTSCTSQ